MKNLLPLLLLLASCGTTRVMAVGGKSDFDSGLDPASEQSTGGLEVSNGPKGGGLGFEVGARYGNGSGTESGTRITSESYEYYAGARYEWRLDNWSPFISTGLTELTVRGRQQGSSSAHDSNLGYYAAVGTDYHFGGGWHFGGSVRRTIDQNISFLGNGVSADAWQYLLRFGYAF
jgi:hypothetical protein